MNAKSNQCPSCGKPASGRFCSHCGKALTADAAPSLMSPQVVAPWIALFVALLALVVSLVTFWNQVTRVAVEPQSSPPFASAQSAPGQPPDLSSMTPREAADRLFNRVMTAAERNDAEEAARFFPMAIDAYEALGELDNDARFHVALLYLTAGDIKKAREQLDVIRKSAPKHLLGIILAHDIAERSGDKAGVARAYKDFLAAYDSEIAAGREEYQHHHGSIQRFHAAAQAAVAAKK